MKHLKTILLLTAILLPLCLFAQRNGGVSHNLWTFGIGGGYRLDYMKFTKIAPAIYNSIPDKHNDYVISVFGYKEFGENGHFALRAQLSYLRRGARYVFYTNSFYHGYSLYAKYADFRLPLIINFTAYRYNRLQPYAYVTPLFGMVTGGDIVSSYRNTPTIKLTKANIAEYYFGIGAALGCRYNINARGRNFFVGLEVMYDHGITDTYGQKEKDGQANDIGKIIDYQHEPLTGERLLKGFELQAVLGIPIGKEKLKMRKQEDKPAAKKDDAPLDKPTVVVEIKDTVQKKDDTPAITEQNAIVEANDNDDIEIAEQNNVEDNIEIAEQNNVEIAERNSTLKPITFAFGSATLTSDIHDYLDGIAQTLKNTGAHIKIIGHTDSKGSYAYNLKLSRDRAKSVMEYLVKQGVDNTKITIDGFGSNRPAADNNTEQGRAQNRRVELEME